MFKFLKWNDVKKQVEAVKAHNRALRNEISKSSHSVGMVRTYNGSWVKV